MTMITTDNNSKITIVGVHQDNIILEYYPVTPLNCFKCFKKHLLNLTAIKSKDAPFNSLYPCGNLVLNMVWIVLPFNPNQLIIIFLTVF